MWVPKKDLVAAIEDIFYQHHRIESRGRLLVAVENGKSLCAHPTMEGLFSVILDSSTGIDTPVDSYCLGSEPHGIFEHILSKYEPGPAKAYQLGDYDPSSWLTTSIAIQFYDIA